MTYYMYITLSEEDKIAMFIMDPDSGKLEHQWNMDVSGRPAPLATDPDKKFLYVGRRDIPEVSTFSINQETGGLTQIGTASLGDDPCYLATDKKGKFLLSAYYNGGKAGVHAIGGDGTVQTPPIEWLSTGTGAHSMQTDASNKFAFVPHIAGGKGPNTIFQFHFDENTGHLTPNSPARVEIKEELGPRHFCFHPNKDILYFSDEQGCSVTAYHFDASSGTLSAFQTISTLPEGYSGENSCAQIQIHPSGKFLYAPNRGHNSMACFTLDEGTGELTSIGQVPAEAVPRAFSIDPQGKYLYSAGLETGRLVSYRIDQQSGHLQPLEGHDVGKGPMWVLIVNI